MHVPEFELGDRQRLKSLIRNTTQAKQCDRYRMALLAIEGGEKLEIAALLGVAKSTVEQWAYRYRDGGIEALTPRKPPGKEPKLPREQEEQFKRRMTEGPRPADGVCTLRGRDAVEILNEEFGVSYSLPGVYDLLHRLNLSCLKPRPRHEKNDPEKMEQFKQSAPLLSRK